ncbi:hypothetical protein [Actinoplanes sp. NBRC 101535]|uniref:hypothetical protein n=1 Tax=Actinoplanes sp. NBRC 101535 TaxID=3032196 RepID=UPI0025529CBB|nr:hypothetical protein [Actinoplanes sp. NBRC 101535]
MDHKAAMYLVYLAISVGLTVWVAITLSRNGQIFLEDVFADTRLARAVNQLLTMGFYLLNLGFVAVVMQSDSTIGSLSTMLESLSLKIGLVLLVLGVLHLCNVWLLGRYRRSRLRQTQPVPPLPPVTHLPPAGPHLPPTAPARG